jgi:citrate lyase alpha subunit
MLDLFAAKGNACRSSDCVRLPINDVDMRWSLIVAAGLAGLLLGSVGGAVFTAVIADVVLRLGPVALSRS